MILKIWKDYIWFGFRKYHFSIFDFEALKQKKNKYQLK